MKNESSLSEKLALYHIDREKIYLLSKNILDFERELESKYTVNMDLIHDICENSIDILYNDMDYGYFGDISYTLLEKQLLNRMIKKGYFTIKSFIDDLIDCLIYQYMKTYKPQRQMNKLVRHEFKPLIFETINICNNTIKEYRGK